MDIHFDNQPRFNQCAFCANWKESCELFKLIENIHLPPHYRTLYTFKCAVCPQCREDINSKVQKYMDEYVGNHA